MRNDYDCDGCACRYCGRGQLIVVALVAYILFQGVGQLFQPGFLTEASAAPTAPRAVSPYQLFDSFYLLILTLIISLPISLGGAVFLVEYAPRGPHHQDRLNRHRDAVLAALHWWLHVRLPHVLGELWLGILAHLGRIALTMFNIPILTRVIQQALEDVPSSQRDACLAMGLTRWETTIHVLIPAAMPAIVTGVVLSAGRVFGEAAALLFYLWYVEPGAPELLFAAILRAPHALGTFSARASRWPCISIRSTARAAPRPSISYGVRQPSL